MHRVAITDVIRARASAGPDVSDLPPMYQDAIAQLEKRGWASMKWDGGYSLLHWAAKKSRTSGGLQGARN